MTEKQKKLYLIDGSGFIFRAYHALPPLTRPDGTPVGAVLGFTNMLYRFLIELHADYLAVIFDTARKNFRHEIYPEYKANRAEPPEDLIPQFPIIREACHAFSVPVVEKQGYEADDLIATYAKKAAADDYEVVIVSSDKDLMQLVNDKISLFDHMKNRAINAKVVQEKFGVLPNKVIDVQALAGDSSDNIPGVPGIGVKTAAELIQTYGDLETLLDCAHEIKQPKRRETLTTYKDQALLSRKLVQLCDTAPIEATLETFHRRQPDPLALRTFLEAQGFKTLIKRLNIEDPTKKEEAATQKQSPKKSIRANYALIQDEKNLQAWIETISQQGFVAIDTETTSLKALEAKLVGISLATTPGKACYIPLAHQSGDLLGGPMKQLSLQVVQRHLGPLLENPAILKIGHNIKYDLLVLENHGFRLQALADTMLMAYLTHGGRNSLDELVLSHFDHEMIPYKAVTGTGKNQITFDYVPLEQAKDYAAEDADYTLRLYHIMKAGLLTNQVISVYETLERPLIPVIAHMEKTGIRINPSHLHKLSHDFEKKLQMLEKEIHQLAGHSFNIASPKQLGEILFEKIGIEGGKKTKTGGYGTGSDVLEKLAFEGHQLPAKVLEWRQYAKLKSTYTDTLPRECNHQTGRIHTSYGMASTSTGRLASSDPNLQNIPIRTPEGRAIRAAFVPDDGYVFLSCDYSQIELRLLAHMANIPELTQAFNDNKDIHAATASQVFGVSLEKVDDAMRRKAKAINFGIIYGISAFGLARQLNISRNEASEYIKIYKKQYPGIPAYMENQIHFAQQHGYVRTIMGRRCFVPMINAKNPMQKGFAERQAINAPLQGSNADIIKKAMIRIEKFLHENNFATRMLLQVHDELIFEVPQSEIEKIRPQIQQIMESVIALDVPLKVGTEVGKSWGDFH